MWILLETVNYETLDQFIAGWATKPTLAQLSEVIDDVMVDKPIIRSLKKTGYARSLWGCEYTLTKYKLGTTYK